jgi:hypothetical protein
MSQNCAIFSMIAKGIWNRKAGARPAFLVFRPPCFYRHIAPANGRKNWTNFPLRLRQSADGVMQPSAGFVVEMTRFPAG